MGKRLELHSKLIEILGSGNVYFQPPPTMEMKYPCIVYQRSPDAIRYADDKCYSVKRKYTITVIDKNADTDIPDRLCDELRCRTDRFFTSNNLNHYIFEIHY